MCPLDLKKIVNMEAFRRTFVDKKGDEFLIRPADKNDFCMLFSMYDLFEPKRCAQGIPPADPLLRKQLVRKVINESLNVVAENESLIVGHTCLIDIEEGVRSELEIAVHQNWRDRGIGAAMLSLIIEIARHLNYQRIWLTVDNTNRLAIHIYQLHGFVFVGPFDSEREMELKLK